MIEARPNQTTTASDDGSLKPSSHKKDVEATTTKTPSTPNNTQAAKSDSGGSDPYEPYPYHYNIFDGSPSSPPVAANNLWKLGLYSPLNAYQATPKLEEGQAGQPSPPLDTLSTPGNNPSSSSVESGDSESDEKMPGLPVTDDDTAKPPTYPRNHWPVPPPPPYWGCHPYQFSGGYHHHYPSGEQQASSHNNRRPSHPALYPKPPPGHPVPDHPVYRSSGLYGHYGGHLPPVFMPPPPPQAQEYIQDVTNNDVVLGRGGRVNGLPGNRRFRQFINDFKLQYLNESKQRKPAVAMRVLDAVRSSNPPGRFLVQCGDMGYLICAEERAREKASQALREGAAKLRKQGYFAKVTTETTPPPTAMKRVAAGNNKRGKTIVLPTNETKSDKSSSLDDPDYIPPPQKKIKQEHV